MGMYNGRRYDAARIRGYFDDIEAAFDDLKKVVGVHTEETIKLIDDETWIGEDAESAKHLLTVEEENLLEDICTLQDDMVELQNEIMEMFAYDVDSASDAVLDYDTLEGINENLSLLYLDYEEAATN